MYVYPFIIEWDPQQTKSLISKGKKILTYSGRESEEQPQR